MKTFLSLFLVLCMSTVQAQTVNQLDPATVTYTSPKVLTSSNTENLKFEVNEETHNEFMNDPIKFVETNFDYKSLGLIGFDEVEVTFVNKKGYLKASFNGNGDLVSTSQSFKNIAIPNAVWKEIYGDNVGWVMVSNKYTASGTGNKIDKDLYRIKFVNGTDTKRIKFAPNRLNGEIAGY